MHKATLQPLSHLGQGTWLQIPGFHRLVPERERGGEAAWVSRAMEARKVGPWRQEKSLLWFLCPSLLPWTEVWLAGLALGSLAPGRRLWPFPIPLSGSEVGLRAPFNRSSYSTRFM